MHFQSPVSWLLAAMVLLAPALSPADVYVSTLAKSNDADVPVTTAAWIGVPFTTDGQSYSLGSITANLRETLAGTLVAALYAGNGSGLPNNGASPLTTNFTFGAVGISNSDVIFTPGSAVTLDAATEYVFVLRPTSGSYVWTSTLASNGFDQPGGGSWSMAAATPFSNNGGTTWTDSGLGVSRMRGAVDATAVPEPGIYALIAGVVALGALLLRRAGRRIAR